MKNKQILPKSIIFFVVLLAVFVVLLTTIFIPTINKIPQYQLDHNTAVSEVAEYEYYLANQKTVEEKIAEYTAEYEKKQEELYVDAKSSIEDLQAIFTKLDINMTSMTRNDGIQDPQGRTSTGGIPLYTTSINFSYNGNMSTTKKLMHYLEQESKGCYFINSLNMSPIENSNNFTVSFSVTLYYFDSTQVVVQPTTVQPTT